MLIKVIIVDDEPAIREGIKNAVNWEKYDMEISAVVGAVLRRWIRLKNHHLMLSYDICLDVWMGWKYWKSSDINTRIYLSS